VPAASCQIYFLLEDELEELEVDELELEDELEGRLLVELELLLDEGAGALTRAGAEGAEVVARAGALGVTLAGRYVDGAVAVEARGG
jgi:hypothetical protein